jgi:hypothetical protein
LFRRNYAFVILSTAGKILPFFLCFAPKNKKRLLFGAVLHGDQRPGGVSIIG